MSQQAYIWQRVWSDPLREAVVRNSDKLDGLTVLHAEFHPSQGVGYYGGDIDYESLKESSLPVTLALRLNLDPGYDVERSFQSGIIGWVKQAIATARAHGVEPVAVEIDFDCPTSQLKSYAAQLREVRKACGGVSLSITTLPTWMSRPDAFRALVEATDHYVLQVHSIKRPQSFDDVVSLCDPEDTQRWMEQAAGFGVSFHVALPTYAYRIAFNEAGALVEVAGENASLMQNPDFRYRVIRANPEAMAGVVRGLDEALLKNCEGIIWYRLPIGNEQRNWDERTWHAVMSGVVDQSGWQVHAVPQADGAIELLIESTSAVEQAPPSQVVVSWSGANVLAWDGQRNYAVKNTLDHGLVWQWPEQMAPPQLSQGTRWTIGWLRLDGATALNFSLIQDAD
ncbi:MAG: DUF3142 domain-containing protein [Lentimonas sp.]